MVSIIMQPQHVQWSVELVSSVYTVPRIEDQHLIDKLFYQEDEYIEMRQAAFIAECEKLIEEKEKEERDSHHDANRNGNVRNAKYGRREDSRRNHTPTLTPATITATTTQIPRRTVALAA